MMFIVVDFPPRWAEETGSLPGYGEVQAVDRQSLSVFFVTFSTCIKAFPFFRMCAAIVDPSGGAAV